MANQEKFFRALGQRVRGLRKKRGYTEPITRPEDRERMQQKIDRWARSGSGDEGPSDEEDKPDKTSKLWPPPLPSSNGEPQSSA